MPETRRSQRRAATDNAPTTKLRLTLANDPFLNSPEFSTNLYSSAPYAVSQSNSHQSRHISKGGYASSSNSMDIDSSLYGTSAYGLSDEESMSDEELSPRGSTSGGAQGGSRRRYTKRHDPAASVSKSRPESDNKVLRNREAAQQFRQRQREHILVLQAEHERLVAENRAFQEHMSRLRLQKEDLDRDINYARSFLEHTMSIAMSNLRHTNRLDQLEPVLAHA